MSPYEKPTLERVELREELRSFLAYEAECLDDHRLHDWYDLLTEDVTYEVPRRIVKEVGDDVSPFSEKSFHLQEDADSLRARIDRYDKDYAWSENPPSRTRRIVSNVRIDAVDGEASDDGAEVETRNNFVMLRLRNEEYDPVFFSGERRDLLRRVDGRLRLADRRVLLDQTVIGSQNLSVFL